MISTIASACPAETFTDAQVSAAIQRHPSFQTFRLYLSGEATSQLARTTHFYYGTKIQSILVTLQNEVDRIASEWKREGLPRKAATKVSETANSPAPASPLINQGPCGVLKLGGVGNRAKGGSCGAIDRHLSDAETATLAATVVSLPESASEWLSVETVNDEDSPAYATEIYKVLSDRGNAR
jgi:hypothetical protein